MGKAVTTMATQRGHVIHAVVESAENTGGQALTRERLAGCDVALEFTRPDAVVDNLEKLIRLGIPTVCGTTGWYHHLPRITMLVETARSSLLYAPNFSVGVHLFLRTARQLAEVMRERAGFAGSIIEEHHASKRDAPSGTALLLQQQSQFPGAAPPPITSLREGTGAGIHTLSYQSEHETITLTHAARDRQAFAAGVLIAAEWLSGKVGMFTFADVLSGTGG
jgi:4-hydroxy-tetrahydrodipicolinate reductase